MVGPAFYFQCFSLCSFRAAKPTYISTSAEGSYIKQRAIKNISLIHHVAPSPHTMDLHHDSELLLWSIATIDHDALHFQLGTLIRIFGFQIIYKRFGKDLNGKTPFTSRIPLLPCFLAGTLCMA